MKTAIFDIETNGLLDSLTTIHILAVRDCEQAITHVFRKNDVEDTIAEGVALLQKAEVIAGHNVCHFDIPAIQKLFPDFVPEGIVRDTLVMARLIYPTIKEDHDFRAWERGKFPGKLIGSHSLEAWGHRLNMHKGEYADGWDKWSQAMEDYCVQDIVVTETLYNRIRKEKYPEAPIVFEHQIHDLMGRQERNGFPFDIEAANALAVALQKEVDRYTSVVTAHFGNWFAPARKKVISPLWENSEDKTTYEKPDFSLGEDDSRSVWAKVETPKKTLKYKDPSRPDKEAGAAYCPIVRKEFNPTSREQIIDRFTTIYKWSPQEFTETGRPSVDDDVLRALAGKIPMAMELAEIFYFNKRLGQLRDGTQAWLKRVSPDGKIRHRCNVGGTVSGRASHTNPNLAQVPRVVTKKEVDPETGRKKTVLVHGREGDHGWDCRNLFYVPDPFRLVGCDLSGIEFRCLANLTARYDNGALIDTVLNGDIHEVNRVAAGLETRDQAKTFIYALVYGAGDWKIGHIADPEATDNDKKALGRQLKNKFFERIPALGQVVRDVQKQSRKGYLVGLDGRFLAVRGEHAALNLQLQSDAALVAKKWVLLFEEYMEDRGLIHAWNGDFAHLAWIHDEIQIAVKEEYAQIACEFAVKAAADAGRYFNFQCPVDAQAKIGKRWAETH